jgi:glycosyltransferase involved in cell wall biosynthesis
MTELRQHKRPPLVIAVQNGARHNYAVPVVLESAGMLDRFYTDICGNIGVGSFASVGRFLPLIGPAFQRLHNRRVPPTIARKTFTFEGPHMLDWIGKKLSEQSQRSRVSEAMIGRGFGNATMIYSSLGWGHLFLEEARKRGLTVVTEFYVRPSLWRVYQSEYRAFPNWESDMPLKKFVDCRAEIPDPCTVSDYVIAPSTAVLEDVVKEHGFPKERIAVVSYGVADSFFEVRNTPVPGRILFVGTCSLGKGIHYFAMASDLVLSTGQPKYDFRAAGYSTELVRTQPVCRHITFLGRLSRAEMVREYERADILVCPSLSESFGMAILEAAACGVPVITTAEAGSVVRDGIDGRIIPSRDPQALADAITEIVEDRQKRDQMAAAARQRARDFTWERYGERLIAALRGFARPEASCAKQPSL